MDENPLKKRVTVRDIAEAVNLHFSTVAEALRDSPRLKKETKERVQAMAKKMGYQRDPMLSALNAYRTRTRELNFQGVIGWLNCFPDEAKFQKDTGAFNEYLSGAHESIQQHGYKLEKFWLGDKNMTESRLSGILRARNIRGLLIGPVPEDMRKLNLEWGQLCAVRFGYSLESPRLARVSPHQFRNVCIAYARLRQKGYTRIAMICPKKIDERMGRQFSGAFLAMQASDKEIEKIPPMIEDLEKNVVETIEAYLNATSPQVVLANPSVCRLLLDTYGKRVPTTLGIASFSVHLDNDEFAGIYENSREIGKAAANLVVSMLQGNEPASTEFSRSTLITGHWRDGRSVAQKESL